MILKNDNGIDYNVLEVVEFNRVDSDYYKNSWQKFRYGFLKSPNGFVVADMVGETSWGQGIYFDFEDEESAKGYFEILKKKYTEWKDIRHRKGAEHGAVKNWRLSYNNLDKLFKTLFDLQACF